MRIMAEKQYCGPNDQTINPFIKKFVKNIAICTREYNRICLEEWEYAYSNFLHKERQIYSVMSAAMHNLTPVHQSESPIIRKRDRRRKENKERKNEGAGRVDLWSYKDGMEYYFEFKRLRVGLKALQDGKIPKKKDKSWKKLVEQVKQVEAGLPDGDNVCCVGLQVVTPFRTSQNREEFMDEPRIKRKQIREFLETFKPSADAVLWYQNQEDMRFRPIEWDEQDMESKWEFHPCHLFFFTISST